MDSHEFESPEHDRRRGKRFNIQAPAIVRMGDREIWAFTVNISTCGTYFTVAAVDQIPSPGDILNIVIKISPTVSSAKPCFITGRGRVIRMEERQWDEAGIAVEFLDFAIQSELVNEAGNLGSDVEQRLHVA